MSQLTIVANRTAIHQQSHAAALARGFAAHGITSTITTDWRAARTKVVACWGWRTGAALRASGKEVIVMERGYIGDRSAWTSIALNGLNGLATWPASAPMQQLGERFERYHAELYRPWRGGTGKYILIIGQVPGDASLRGRNLYGAGNWYEQQATAAQQYGLPVFFRPHPLAARRGGAGQIHAASSLTGGLSEALRDAALVVTYNSNTGVDSLLAGVPTVVMDGGGMGYEIALPALPTTLDVPEPDAGRYGWACRLAGRQWSIQEISSGVAVAPLLPMLPLF